MGWKLTSFCFYLGLGLKDDNDVHHKTQLGKEFHTPKKYFFYINTKQIIISPPRKTWLCDHSIFRVFLRSPRFPLFLITPAFYVFFANNFCNFYCFLSCNTSYFPYLFHYCKNDRNMHKTSILCMFLCKLDYLKLPRILQLRPHILAMSASRFFFTFRPRFFKRTE